MNFPTIYTGGNATAEAAVFGSLTPIANIQPVGSGPIPEKAPTDIEWAEPAPTVQRFEVGKVYATRSLCDWDCIFRFIVTARSEKTVTIQSVGGPDRKPYGKTTRRTVRAYGGVESLKPHGSYSMAPTLHADKGDIE